MNKFGALLILLCAGIAGPAGVYGQTLEEKLDNHGHQLAELRQYNQLSIHQYKELRKRVDEHDRLLQELNNKLIWCTPVQPGTPAPACLATLVQPTSVPAYPTAALAPACVSATSVPVLTQPPAPSPAALVAWEQKQREYFEERFGPLEVRVTVLEKANDTVQQRLEQAVTRDELTSALNALKSEILEAINKK